MIRLVDISGKKFGRLLVIGVSHRDKNRNYYWDCLCDCGKTKKVSGGSIKSGVVKSCGCLNDEGRRSRLVVHGQARKRNQTQENRAWCEIKRRCYNKNSKAYAEYGGRGIKMCDRWLSSFENFFADVGKKPTPNLSLDRINVNGDYEPNNCRWATKKQQASNTRRNTWISSGGESMILGDWATQHSISKNTVKRLNGSGWLIGIKRVPKSIILDTEVGVYYYSIKEAAKSRGYNYSNLIASLSGRLTNKTPFIKV